MQSAIVVTINGTEFNGTAFIAMSRWSDPKEMATTLAFRVEHPMNTGLKSSSDCAPSDYVIQRRLLDLPWAACPTL